ncbi:MAG: hypothetical protein QXJ97_04560 [Desulfurococcaceae archaeon]
MEVTYPVNVIVDNVKVGEGTIKLIDEYQDDVTQRIVTRQVSGKVVVDSVEAGSVSGTYEDYVTYGSGGTRTVNIPVRTFTDSILLSFTELVHTDQYGAVVTQPPPQPPPEVPPPPEELKPQPYPKPWWLLLLPLLFFIFRKKKEKEQFFTY